MKIRNRFLKALALSAAVSMVSVVGLAATQKVTAVSDMRGDMGPLEDFGPRGAAWLPDGHLFLADWRYTVFHIFDTSGRRYAFIKHPEPQVPEAHYDSMCSIGNNTYLAVGNHYHINNNPRHLASRSVIHKMTLLGESFAPGSGKENYSPDNALRATGFYGDSAEKRLEISGTAADLKRNRIFFGCSQPLQPDGTVLILSGRLDKLLTKQDDMKLETVQTGLKPAQEPALGTNFFVSDLQYVGDRGLAILMTSQDKDEKVFGSNQIWFLRDGDSTARLVAKELVPGNRATAIAIRYEPKSKDFTAALVCDNATEDTKTPSRTVIIEHLTLPGR
jgi:hypothetical protein